MTNIIALEQHIQQRAQGTTVARTVCPKQATFYAFRMREIFNASLDCVMWFMQYHGILKTATWNDEAVLSENRNTVGTTVWKV